MSRNLRALITKSSIKERFKTAQNYLQKLKFLVDDVRKTNWNFIDSIIDNDFLFKIDFHVAQPQHALPDVFVWMIVNGKRVAYHRFLARDLIYSMIEEECGFRCGKVQTIFLHLPGKQATTSNGWMVQSKLSIYLWLGIIKDKQFSYSGLPKGFDLSSEIRNAERPGALAPSNIHYLEKHVRRRKRLHFTFAVDDDFLFCRFFNCAHISIKRAR